MVAVFYLHSTGGRLREVQLQGFDGEKFCVLEKWSLKGGVVAYDRWS